MLVTAPLPPMFSLFGRRPLLDDASRQWLLDAFAWALENFDADIFFTHSVLVLPTNQFFPGRVDSMEGAARLILTQVKSYAATSHWPTSIADQRSCATIAAPRIEIPGPLRDPHARSDDTLDPQQCLLFPYNPQQINNPEAMIASFAHILAHYLGQMAAAPPPGGMDYWPQATELLAIYLGFGLMFANSAFTFRGGCGSCYNPNATRDAYLGELEATYALAIFASLKGIPAADVSRHLKKHLRGFYKAALKELGPQEQLYSKVKINRPSGAILP